MTRLQKIQLKMSECRQAINTLLDVENRTDEQQADLEKRTGEIQQCEPELRAAIAAEPDPTVTRTDPTLDTETRERLELRGRANLGAFLTAALGGRVVNGAEAEYAAAFKAPSGHIPIDLWEQDRPRTEERAATPAPTTGTGVTVAPVQPFIFAPSIAPMLGIEMPSVGSGGYSEMTVSTSLPAGPRTKGTDASDTAGALTAVNATPRSISGRMSITIEDVAAVGQANFESALRQNTSMSVSNSYDDQCLNGDGSAPNVDGLINQLTDPTDPTAVATFDAFVQVFADQIDGLWASRMREVGIVVNVDAYKLSARTFRGTAANGGPVQTFADYAEKMSGSWSTNKRMPATAATIARGIVYRMGRPGLRTASHPTWGTVSIDDIYSDSRSGQRHFTVHILVGSKVLIVQPEAYSLIELKVA